MTDIARKFTRRQLLAASAAAPLAAGWQAAPAAAPASATPAAAPGGLAWPAIALLDGRVLAPGNWRDTAAIVVYWSTTCPFCRRHNVHVDKLYRASRLDGASPLRVLGVALDRDPAAVRRYMADHHYAFPVAMNTDRLQGLFTAGRGIPMTYVIDRTGRLVKAFPGEMFEEDVMELPRLAERGRG